MPSTRRPVSVYRPVDRYGLHGSFAEADPAPGPSKYPSGAVRFAVEGRTLQATTAPVPAPARRGQILFGGKAASSAGGEGGKVGFGFERNQKIPIYCMKHKTDKT